jgi:hypothetical protein
MSQPEISSLKKLAEGYERRAREVIEQAEKQAAEFHEKAAAYRLVIEDLSRALVGASSKVAEIGDAFQRSVVTAREASTDSLIDAARVAVQRMRGPFDVTQFRALMQQEFAAVANSTEDRNAFSKLLKKLEEEERVKVRERGAGRRATVYEAKGAAM